MMAKIGECGLDMGSNGLPPFPHKFTFMEDGLGLQSDISPSIS